MRLRLTDYETGRPIYVQKESIVVCQELKAFVAKPLSDNPSQEEGRRTKIDTNTGDNFLVRKSADDVMGGRIDS